MKRILSGIQPTGRLHLGNYFGMMKPALEQQGQGDLFLFIADYHALTSVPDPDQLRSDIHSVAVDFLACGLDPGKTTFYRQSDIPEVTELSWLLSVVTPMGLLERCHSYKDKIARGIPPSQGLFSYPVLMAADILAMRSDAVPVGRDQKQHLEVTRDIAGRFNLRYGQVFVIPEPDIRDEVAVVPGIDGQKMSKSYNNTIEIFADPDEIRRKVMRIVTDSTPVEAPKDPGRCSLFALFRLFADEDEHQELAARYRAGGVAYSAVKKELASRIVDYFAPFRRKREELLANPDYVQAVLAEGARKARSEAQKTLKAARKAVGLES
ncbi:MAG TPA: tryptophan--tRNA ligase [Kiritimatiellae bacterium]|nr:tryptophan--tRNA ligase [Kiritimatiellia bacterium]